MEKVRIRVGTEETEDWTEVVPERRNEWLAITPFLNKRMEEECGWRVITHIPSGRRIGIIPVRLVEMAWDVLTNPNLDWNFVDPKQSLSNVKNSVQCLKWACDEWIRMNGYWDDDGE